MKINRRQAGHLDQERDPASYCCDGPNPQPVSATLFLCGPAPQVLFVPLARALSDIKTWQTERSLPTICPSQKPTRCVRPLVPEQVLRASTSYWVRSWTRFKFPARNAVPNSSCETAVCSVAKGNARDAAMLLCSKSRRSCNSNWLNPSRQALMMRPWHRWRGNGWGRSLKLNLSSPCSGRELAGHPMRWLLPWPSRVNRPRDPNPPRPW